MNQDVPFFSFFGTQFGPFWALFYPKKVPRYMTYGMEGSFSNVISFNDNDFEGIQNPHNEAIIVSMMVAKHNVRRVLIDNESSADILFYDTFS